MSAIDDAANAVKQVGRDIGTLKTNVATTSQALVTMQLVLTVATVLILLVVLFRRRGS